MASHRNVEYAEVLSERTPGLDPINAPPPSLEERVAFALAFVDGVRPRIAMEPPHEDSPRLLWACRDPFRDAVGWDYTPDGAYAKWASSFSGLNRGDHPVSIP